MLNFGFDFSILNSIKAILLRTGPSADIWLDQWGFLIFSVLHTGLLGVIQIIFYKILKKEDIAIKYSAEKATEKGTDKLLQEIVSGAEM